LKKTFWLTKKKLVKLKKNFWVQIFFLENHKMDFFTTWKNEGFWKKFSEVEGHPLIS